MLLVRLLNGALARLLLADALIPLDPYAVFLPLRSACAMFAVPRLHVHRSAISWTLERFVVVGKCAETFVIVCHTLAHVYRVSADYIMSP